MKFDYVINDSIDLNDNDLRNIANKINSGDDIRFAISTVLDDKYDIEDTRYSSYDFAESIEDDVKRYIEENLSDDDDITFNKLNYIISKYDNKDIAIKINNANINMSFLYGNISYIDISMYNSTRELVHYIIKICPNNIDITKRDITVIIYNKFDISSNTIGQSMVYTDTVNLDDIIYTSDVLTGVDSDTMNKLIELFKEKIIIYN